MIRAIRNFLALAMLTVLAACGGGGDSLSGHSKFRSYNGPPVTQIVVNKGARKMYLLNGQSVLKSYDVELGNQPVGAKRFEGDGKTPEGVYFIDRFNPRSSYHLSVGVSYPNPQDTAFAESMGFRAGSDIFIHGRGAEGASARAARKKDWTAGCIAVEDSEIEEIFAMLRPGVP
ncbi:MAG: L,D-transpeptidase family protein, partial [Paracoccus sp. (in: a-proteobacteria)]|nr:L,D-transpeptidase family protein [Paracoccus sp. (in: a-proteobacteria)]